MIDWERLVNAVLYTAILISGIIFIINLPIYAFLVLVAVGIVLASYKALGEVSDKDKDNE